MIGCFGKMWLSKDDAKGSVLGWRVFVLTVMAAPKMLPWSGGQARWPWRLFYIVCIMAAPHHNTTLCKEAWEALANGLIGFLVDGKAVAVCGSWRKSTPELAEVAYGFLCSTRKSSLGFLLGGGYFHKLGSANSQWALERGDEKCDGKRWRGMAERGPNSAVLVFGDTQMGYSKGRIIVVVALPHILAR